MRPRAMSAAAFAAIACVVSLPGVASAELIHHWSLDETSGGTAINTVGGVNGTLGGASAWSNGKIGRSFRTANFTNGYVNSGNVPITGSFALSFWVNTDNAALDWRNMVSKHDTANQRSFWIGQHGDNGRMRFGMYFDGQNELSVDSAGVVLNTGQWAHVTAMWNEQTKVQSFYVNGNLAGSVTRTGQSFITPRSSNLLFNTNHTSSDPTINVGSWARFEGALDDVAIWDRSLSAGKIRAMHAAEMTPALSGYNAADYQTLFRAYETNFAQRIGNRRWTHATGLSLGEGNAAAQPNGFVVQLDAAGRGVSARSSVRLTADPLHENLADATNGNDDDAGFSGVDQPAVFVNASGFSEIDGLTRDDSLGSADFRPMQLFEGDVYAMLWLSDTDGADDRAALRGELQSVAGDVYDLLQPSDAMWQELTLTYGGFDTLVRFNSATVAGAVNWDFASHADVVVDRLAVVAMGGSTCVPEPSALALLVAAPLVARRRR